MRPADEHRQPPPFVALDLTTPERAQIEAQLSAAFELTPEAARVWVATTARRGACFGRVESDGVIAASYAAETLTLAREHERLTVVMLQSCYVHPDFRGRGYGLARADVAALRRRFAADAVVLTLFDDGLVPYWRRRGFDVVQRPEVVSLGAYLSRAGTAFSPVLSEEAIAAKLAEDVADGALVTRVSGAGCDPAGARVATASDLILVRYPGDDAVAELIAGPAPGRRPAAGSDMATAAGDDGAIARDGDTWVAEGRDTATRDILLRLKTVMSSPGDLDLVCAIDL